MFDMMPFGHRERDFMRSFDDFEKAFSKSFAGMFENFKTDILDKGDHYLLQAELPGFSKNDIHIDLEGDYLTVRAEQKEEKEEKNHEYVRRERSCRSYARSFNISDVAADKILASYQDGVLELSMPKKEKTGGGVKRIEIK